MIAYIIRLIAVPIFLIALVACDNSGGNQVDPDQTKVDSSSANQPLEPLSLRLKWVVYSSFGPHYVALEEGFFRDEGLEVEIRPGGPGIDPIRLVATGADDVGLASYDQILIAREKGIPVVAIAEDTVSSGVGFVALETSGIQKPGDFVGRRIGYLPGTDKATMYDALMAKLEIDRTNIDEVVIGSNLELLFSETIDVFPGFITNQPVVAEERGFPVNIIDPEDYGVQPGGNVFFTSEDTLARKRDQLVRFLRAELRAHLHSQILSSEQVVDYVKRHNDKLDSETEKKIWQATKRVLLSQNTERVGFMPRETWLETMRLFQASGLLSNEAAIFGAYTNDLVEVVDRSDFPIITHDSMESIAN